MATTSQSVISAEDAVFQEQWESVSPSQWWVIHINLRGDEVPELVSPEQTFMISTRDRKITQQKVRDASNDPFANGAFRPMVVPESVTIDTNPNALGRDDIMRIFASSDLAWTEYMKVIDSAATLGRMMEISEEPSVAATVTLARVRQVEKKFKAIRPQTQIETKDDQLAKFLGDGNADSSRSADSTKQARTRKGGGYTR